MSARILIVDDHKIVREGFSSLLNQKKDLDIEVVAQAGDGRSAIEMIPRHMPNIILMDITMPDMNGIEAAQKILHEYPNIKIIFLSIHSNPQYIERAIKAGAKGYLLKNCAFDELERAIETVMNNQLYLSPSITGVFLGSIIMNPHEDQSISPKLQNLTSREREILQLLAEGKSTKDIADHLNLGIKTVQTHRQSIMDKLNMHNVVDLVKFAIREGVISIEE